MRERSMIKQQVEKVEHTEDLLNHLLDGIKEYAIFMVDTRGQIVTWNSGVKRLLGYEEEEFIGRDFSIIFSVEDISNGIHTKELERALSVGNANDERWHTKKDGTKFWASGLVTRVERDGKIVGATKIMRDQTDKKLIEEERLRHTQELAAANKELAQFAEVLSDDINSPLQTMFNLASTLRDGSVADPQAMDSIKRIESSAESVMNLVNDVLHYSKTGENKSSSSFIDGDELMHKILLGLEMLIDEKNVKVIVGSIPELLGNETNIERVLRNLIENAIKYSCNDLRSRLEIFAEEDNEKVTIGVRDYGPGISLKDQERIFSLFERANTSVQGRGLGLAISKKLVQVWGGRLWVESEPRHGSTFYFTVPSRPAVSSFAERSVRNSADELRAG
jgi:PAS domain S-box-containing protein